MLLEWFYRLYQGEDGDSELGIVYNLFAEYGVEECEELPNGQRILFFTPYELMDYPFGV